MCSSQNNFSDEKNSATSKVWKRIISGVILALFIIPAVYFSQIFCIALICIASVLLSFEYYQIIEKIGISAKLKYFGTVLTFFICLSPWTDRLNIETFIFLTILLAIFIQIIQQSFSKTNTAFLSIASIIFGTMYIGWTFGVHLIRLRKLTADNMNAEMGAYLLFFLFAVVWMGDTGAYTFGKLFGKHKLIPSISPGKTIEGSIGGLFSGMLGGLVVKIIWLNEILGWTHFIILTIILGVAAQIGDLCESILKRNANVKDSGNLIPGHGGIFDRCDSLVLATALLYYYFIYFIK